MVLNQTQYIFPFCGPDRVSIILILCTNYSSVFVCLSAASLMLDFHRQEPKQVNCHHPEIVSKYKINKRVKLIVRCVALPRWGVLLWRQIPSNTSLVLLYWDAVSKAGYTLHNFNSLQQATLCHVDLINLGTTWFALSTHCHVESAQ